ncbi:MAG: hypothetical protein ACYCSP_09450 [Acidobacteriaceae bacterium]
MVRKTRPFWRGEAELDRKIRNLIEQLGEAIHETVAESDQIAGVVRNIRAEGFEVMLVLEATIGLNEATQEPAASTPAGTPESGPFTPLDLNFLSSLRIRITQEPNGPDPTDKSEDAG